MVTLDRQRAFVADRSVAFSTWLARQHEQQQEMMLLRKGVAGSRS
jgi:hypothetical protein